MAGSDSAQDRDDVEEEDEYSESSVNLEPPKHLVSVLHDSVPSPDNALHLHVPAHHMPSVSTSSSPYFPPSKASTRNSSPDSVSTGTPDTHANGSSGSSKPNTFRVRFRSRVRIGSGLRHSQQPYSVDSSPSSSISAPLRYNHEESDAEQAGPIIPISSSRPFANGKPGSRRSAPALGVTDNNDNANERTPLLRASGSRLGVRTRRLYGLADEEEEARAARCRARSARRQEEEVVFGKWPWRLFNGYWWLWKCEPAVCCCPADDSDSDLE